MQECFEACVEYATSLVESVDPGYPAHYQTGKTVGESPNETTYTSLLI